MDQKVCFKCSLPKSLDEFPKHPQMKDGHLNKCKLCNRADAKAWAQKNPERVADNASAWRAANPDKRKEYAAKSYGRAKASGKILETAAVRRRRENATRVAPVSRKAIKKRDGLWCHICESDIDDPRKVVLDHVIPLARGGEHTEANLKVAHRSCNAWKHDRLMSELVGLTPPTDVPWEERVDAKRKALQSAAMKAWWADPANAEVIVERNRKLSEAKLGQPGHKGGPGCIRKGWGNGFDCCQECGTTERRHKSKGLCDACYLRSYRSALPEDVRRKQVHGRTGPPKPRVPTEEARRKTSESLKAAYASGKRLSGHSEATKQKISETKLRQHAEAREAAASQVA